MTTNRASKTVVSLAGLLLFVLVGGCGASGEDQAVGVRTGPLEVSGGRIAQFRKPGSDNSIEEYGKEGDEAELEQAARNVHGYLVAQVEKRWSSACAYLSKYLRSQLEREATPAEQSARNVCASVLRSIDVPLPGSTPYKMTTVNAGSVRVKGNYGFLFFNANTDGHKLLLMRDNGIWKVGGLFPTPLH